VSVEQIVLLVIFLVVPLVQHLLRALGKGDAEEEPPQAEQQPRPVSRRPLPPPPVPAREWQPPPVAIEEFLQDEEMRPELGRPLVQAVRDVPPLPDPPSRQRIRRRPAGLGLYHRPALRHAMVLMTILEPCRAIRPHQEK
jgi:hypothetical protein